MRLRRLELRRYGHLSDVTLDFPAAAALCVVHGANEAGKSTALAALGDGLFGFRDTRSGPRPDFLHGSPQLRVGLTLRASDGRELAIVRRKGRSNTLSDAAGAPVADEALRPFLGGAGRDTFENTFGLNGARLREGGKVLAEGGGSVGESLFAAGTGLLGLRAALARLEDEARTLVGRANASRRLNTAVERWKQADAEVRLHSVPPRAWSDADADHAEAVAALAQVLREVEALRREESLLQRLRRVAPLLAQLDGARARAEGLADAPHLAADAAELLREGVAARERAMRDAAREAKAAGDLVAMRDALVRSPGLIAAQDAIDHLAERRPVAVQAEADRPGVLLELHRQRTLVAQAMTELGAGSTPEAARDALPSDAARRAAQRLVSRHAGLLATAAAAGRERDATALRQAGAAMALQGSDAAPDPALLRATIDRVRAEGRLDDDVTHADEQAVLARRRAERALAALPRWAGSVTELLARPMPLRADEALIAEQLAAAQGTVAQAQAERDRRAAERQQEVDRLAGFGPVESVPTPDAVRAARAARDSLWQSVRRRLEGGPPATAPDDDWPGSLPLAFERRQAEADQMADRRADDAQRVADYLQTSSRLSALEDRTGAAAAALAEAERQLAQAVIGWQRLWSAMMDEAGPPAAMTEWRRLRDNAVELSQAADAAERTRDGLRTRRDAARADLVARLPEVADEPTLTGALARADLACGQREKAAEAFRAVQELARREALALQSDELKVQHARDALAGWTAEWAAAAALLGLPAACHTEAAEAALAAWARVAEAGPVWRNAELRVGQMTDTTDAFAAAVDAAMALAGLAATGEPAVAAAARLVRQLREARAAEQSFVALSGRIEGHARAATAAAAQQAAAEASIAALQAQAGAADLAGLEAAIVSARSREAAEAEAVRLQARLIEEGDGFGEAALRVAAAGYDPDRATARLDAIGHDLGALGEQREQWASRRARTEDLLAGMQQEQRAASAAQEAHHALADAKAAAERYARLHVAATLLRSSIDRFRRGQQGPLLQAAGRHFAALTGGRYARLAVDEDRDGRMLMLAMRDDGSECPVEALSEGTADQLYLALRVAMVEAHAGASEPLPFVADDLLVHFDDARAAAAIRLLTELGRTTQVILFSHHDHVARLAQAMPSADVAIVRLPRLAAAGAEP